MLIGAIPLASLNRHTPICCDTRLAKAASSLDAPNRNACPERLLRIPLVDVRASR